MKKIVTVILAFLMMLMTDMLRAPIPGQQPVVTAMLQLKSFFPMTQSSQSLLPRTRKPPVFLMLR